MENGILVKPNNVEQLVEALNTLCNDRELAQRMGRQAKHDFDTRLNYDNFYHKITALYSTLLSD
jgi:glycosyltransferase involved in cell wall biosynthesis